MIKNLKNQMLAMCLLMFGLISTVVLVDAAQAQQDNMQATKTLSRDNGATVTVQYLGDLVVHSYNSPYQAFANATHIIETPHRLVLIDMQFLLPFAQDFRAYADSLGKSIDRVLLTHHHPDHFLGSEAFADLDVYALSEVVSEVKATGQAEIDEKQAEFGNDIASSFVVPNELTPGSVEIDGVTFNFEKVVDAEAEVQLVTSVPEYGVISVGDIVYHGTHLIMAGAPQSWIVALQKLKADSANYPVVLPGHGLPASPAAYDENIAWLTKAAELMESAASAEAFKSGLVEAFPDLEMQAAIDFVLPYLFPENASEKANEVGQLTTGVIEVINFRLKDTADIDAFLQANKKIREDYVTQQPGFIARQTGQAEDGSWIILVYWDNKADAEASIANFGNAPGINEFASLIDFDTMVNTIYDISN